MNNYNFDYFEYKKKIRPQKNIPLLFYLFIILVLILSITFLNNTSSTKKHFYFVEIDSFLIYKDANHLAISLQQQNAGGYIYFDGTYHVLASAYLNKDDAKKVKESIIDEHNDAKVFTLSCNSINLKTKSSNNYKIIKSCVDANNVLRKEFYKLVCELDKKNISFQKFKILLDNIKSNYKENTKKFIDKNVDNSTYLQAKKHILSNLEALQTDFKEENLIQTLHYNLIKISVNSYLFLDCFDWFLFLTISTICQTPNAIKNKAKNFFKTPLDKWFATSAPIKLKTHPTAANNHVSLNATSLFFAWIIKATTLMGKKAIKLTPCALNCL